jgi:glycerophosphoryl diester phosphodiesterase
MRQCSASFQLPWIIAHRGARREAPDNTRSAFERALSYPIDGIELDVQMSVDGMPILYHDRTLNKVGLGRRRVAELTYARLKTLDWGGWFHRDFAGEPLPTLDQTLSWLADRTRLLIEIKSQPKDHSNGHSTRLTHRVVQALNTQKQFKTLPLILSFDPKVLFSAWKMAPQWRYVLNISEKEPKMLLELPSSATKHLWALDVNINRLSSELKQWTCDRGLRLFTYTCNTPRHVRRAMDLQVDAVITDKPGWLRHYFKELVLKG